MGEATFLAEAERVVPELLADLETLVNVDSGTYTPAGVARVADYLQPRLAELGGTVERVPGRKVGPQLVTRLRGQGRERVLLVGHMDTVFPDGEAERRPFRVAEGRAYGPGVFDMKSGLLVGLYALRLLRAAGAAQWEELTFLCNSDEEIGSPESHDLVAELAAGRDAVLVLEPARDPHLLTTARKGVGMYTLEVTGRSAHAGVEPERGRSAILELAHRIVELHALNGTIPGVTVNVGVIEGGERPNVVAETARAQIDIRAADQAGVRAIEEALQQVAAHQDIPETSRQLSGEMRHLPFEQSEASARFFALAREVGTGLGLDLMGVATGGASDGNTAAALGVPTLDGLGPAGGLAHNPGEYVEVASIALRVALLAGLLQRMSELVMAS